MTSMLSRGVGSLETCRRRLRALGGWLLRRSGRVRVRGVLVLLAASRVVNALLLVSLPPADVHYEWGAEGAIWSERKAKAEDARTTVGGGGGIEGLCAALPRAARRAMEAHRSSIRLRASRARCEWCIPREPPRRARRVGALRRKSFRVPAAGFVTTFQEVMTDEHRVLVSYRDISYQTVKNDLAFYEYFAANVHQCSSFISVHRAAACATEMPMGTNQTAVSF